MPEIKMMLEKLLYTKQFTVSGEAEDILKILCKVGMKKCMMYK